jgi:hypothetical protein
MNEPFCYARHQGIAIESLKAEQRPFPKLSGSVDLIASSSNFPLATWACAHVKG